MSPTGVGGRPSELWGRLTAESLAIRLLSLDSSDTRLGKGVHEWDWIAVANGRGEPDHNTLWRFWRDNKAAIRNVFKQGLQIAAKANLTGLVLHAVDGTKIETAGASKTQAYHRKDVEKVLAELDGIIDEVMQQTESQSDSGFQYPVAGASARSSGTARDDSGAAARDKSDTYLFRRTGFSIL